MLFAHQASRDLLKQFHIECGKKGLSREEKRKMPLPEGCAACASNAAVFIVV
jgi:hypothetical protein